MGFAEVGEDVAVEVAACWEAVEEEDWVALARFKVVEADGVDGGVVGGWHGMAVSLGLWMASFTCCLRTGRAACCSWRRCCHIWLHSE